MRLLPVLAVGLALGVWGALALPEHARGDTVTPIDGNFENCGPSPISGVNAGIPASMKAFARRVG